MSWPRFATGMLHWRKATNHTAPARYLAQRAVLPPIRPTRLAESAMLCYFACYNSHGGSAVAKELPQRIATQQFANHVQAVAAARASSSPRRGRPVAQLLIDGANGR